MMMMGLPWKMKTMTNETMMKKRKMDFELKENPKK